MSAPRSIISYTTTYQHPILKGVNLVMGIDRVRVDGQRRAPVSPNVDLPLTAVQGELLSVAAWYDNEMGYSARLGGSTARKRQVYCAL